MAAKQLNRPIPRSGPGYRAYRRALYATKLLLDPNAARKVLRDRYYRYKATQSPEAISSRNRWRIIKQKFGLTAAAYSALLETQGGVCAICGRPETARYKGRLKWLAVDHDHVTKKIRGLVCQACNLALGFVGDDPARLKALVAYLERTA